ncbi:MAG: tetratricopeptide repeat protein [Actinomycetota bacterium]|nr:tetratricopeptide repeat protein [Acidimicrobiia bacterium]MDQ3293208.1 tetratricopeptide repeat protein [Actinomycetota bacterium]
MPAIDVTDQTFQTEVIERSLSVPVVVDLWADWCGPCKTLGPILEKVIDETDGKVVLAKVDTETNPQIAAALKVQSIPAVFVANDGRLHQGFVGALPEASVRQFVASLLPTQEEEALVALVAAGDEASLRQAIEIEPGHPEAIVALAELLVGVNTPEALDEALALLERIPESSETRRVAALARLGTDAVVEGTEHVEATLDGLLPKVKDDEEARQAFVDLLEVLGPDDPRTARYRKQLTSRLF